MTIKNLKIVLKDDIIENGFIIFDGKLIKSIGKGCPVNASEAIDGNGYVAMPGFIDLHTHGSCGVDFMDAKPCDFEKIANAFFLEGTTTFLATTLTSDCDSLMRVCENVNQIYDKIPSLFGIHLEGPYINVKYKGAQNPEFIRKPDLNEFSSLQNASGDKIKYISLAPELDGAKDFILSVTKNGVVCSAGHTDATFKDIEQSIICGLTNTTHTHNAMSGHHHRNPGVLSAAMYFDELYTEVICDRIHVCDEALKTFYKIVGPNRFMIVTDSLSAKHSNNESFKLFGLDCIKKNGAAYLTTGNLAGSLLPMNIGVKNMHDVVGANLIDLAKISSYNQAKCLGLNDRGEIAEGKLADIVLLDEQFNVKTVYKEGIKVY